MSLKVVGKKGGRNESKPVDRPEVGREVWRLDQFLKKDLEAPSQLLAPWLQAGDIWMVYSAAGVGKTHFALNVAWAVASGGRYLAWQAPEPQTVLYVDGEMAQAEMQERLENIVRAAERDHSGSIEQGLQSFYGYEATAQPPGQLFPDFGTREGLDVLLDQAQGKRLVVIDNLTTTTRTGSDNAAEDWWALQDALVELRKQNAAVLLVHHSNKSGLDQRGTSARDVILNGKIKLERPQNYNPMDGAKFVVEWEKHRRLSGVNVVSVQAHLQADPEGLPLWDYRLLDDTQHHELLRHLKSGDFGTWKEIAEHLKLSTGRVSQLKREAINDHGLFTAEEAAKWLQVGRETQLNEQPDF